MIEGTLIIKGATVHWTRPTDEISPEERARREARCYDACVKLLASVEDQKKKEKGTCENGRIQSDHGDYKRG